MREGLRGRGTATRRRGQNDTCENAGQLLPSLPRPSPPSLARPQPFHTFILSWVVNVEMPIPHDCQLHRQVVDLHPFIRILQPGRGGGKKKVGHREF